MEEPLLLSPVEWPLPLAIAEFSFSEDKLLLAAYWGNKFEDIGAEEVNNALCYLYAKARAKMPADFPKPERYNLYSRALSQRLDILINSSVYAPLVSLIQRELVLHEEREAILHSPEHVLLKNQSALAFPPQSDTQERLLLQREVSAYGKEKVTVQFLLAEPLANLKRSSSVLEHMADSLVHTNLKNQQFLAFTTRRQALTRQSNLLARLYAEKTRELPPTVYGYMQDGFANNEDDLAIELNDHKFRHMLNCDKHRFCEHLYPDGFARFLLFCRHPTTVVEQKLIASTTTLANTYITEIENDFTALINLRRDDRLASLRAWREYAEKRLCGEVIKSFKEDIRQLQLMYERLLSDGAKQIGEVYVKHQIDALHYYSDLEGEYRERLQTFFNLSQDNVGTNQRLEVLKTVEDMIFKPAYQLPRLMVMAIALESDTFIDAVATMLARHITVPQVYFSSALVDCSLVTESIYRNILKKVSTSDLGLLLSHVRACGCVLLKDCANSALLDMGLSSAIRQTKAHLTGYSDNAETTDLSTSGNDNYELVLKDKSGTTLRINPLTGERRELSDLFPLIEGSSIQIDDDVLRDLENVMIPSVQEFSSFHQLPTTSHLNEDPSETSATIYSAPALHAQQLEESQEPTGNRSQQSQRQDTYRSAESLLQQTRVSIIPFEYIVEEMWSRRAAMREMYKQWSEDVIKMAITAGTEPFQDLLNDILESRKLTKQYQVVDGTVCMTKSGDLYDIDVSGLHIELKKARHYIPIRCNKYILSSATFARVYFECTLKNVPNGTNLAVGVMYDETIFHGHDSPAINGVFITSDGFVFEGGKRRFTGLFLGTNDIVSALVDMSTETMQMYRNGQAILGPLMFNPRARQQAEYFEPTVAKDDAQNKDADTDGEDSNAKFRRPLDIIQETKAALADVSIVFDAEEIVRQQKLQQSIDEKLKERLDAIARSRHVYRIRPAVVAYCHAISQKTRPCLKMTFSKPYAYEKLSNFTNTGYL